MIEAKILRVIDGDSIEVTIEKMAIRLDFVDAPETRGIEKEDGKVSKAWLEKRLPKGNTVKLDLKKEDTYSRFLSVVYKDKININGEMLKLGLVEVYNPLDHNDGEKD
jgi:micrococcal nuclease